MTTTLNLTSTPLLTPPVYCTGTLVELAVVPLVVVPLNTLAIMLPKAVLVLPPMTTTVPPGPNEITVPETVIGDPPGTSVCPPMTKADEGLAVIG
jgi:hypothetical protein